jgi:hypothetical protein
VVVADGGVGRWWCMNGGDVEDLKGRKKMKKKKEV